MRNSGSLLKICGFLFAFLALSAMSGCPESSTNDQGSGGMDDTESGGGDY